MSAPALTAIAVRLDFPAPVSLDGMPGMLLGIVVAFGGRDLPSHVDLSPMFRRYGLAVCNQNGPLCWDYTAVGVLEYELAARGGLGTRLSPGFLAWAASATDPEGSGGSNFGRAYRGLEKYGIAPLSLGGEPDPLGRGTTPSDQTLRAATDFGPIDFHWIRFWNDHDELSQDQMKAIKSENFGQFLVDLPGSQSAVRPVLIDGAGPGVSRSRAIAIGTYMLRKGAQRITFTVTGRGPASQGMFIGLDQIQLVPVV